MPSTLMGLKFLSSTVGVHESPTNGHNKKYRPRHRQVRAIMAKKIFWGLRFSVALRIVKVTHCRSTKIKRRKYATHKAIEPLVNVQSEPAVMLRCDERRRQSKGPFLFFFFAH